MINAEFRKKQQTLTKIQAVDKMNISTIWVLGKKYQNLMADKT